MSRDKNYKKLITSPEWRKLRAIKIAQNPVCEACEKLDRTTPAEEVHHIIPIESTKSVARMTRLAFDINNLQSLCKKCHFDAHFSAKTNKIETTKSYRKADKQSFLKNFLD
ncbi:MAG: HNH endonuclease signature motif containing protein [Tannerellaceae bacterium]